MCNNVSSDNGLDGHRLVENNLANIAHILRYQDTFVILWDAAAARYALNDISNKFYRDRAAHIVTIQ